MRYTSLSELRIDPAKAKFKSVPQGPASPARAGRFAADAPVGMLTIAEAKKALAATFGVKPEAVEITIRG